MSDAENKSDVAEGIPEDWLDEAADRQAGEADAAEHRRMVEAIVFASERPLSAEEIAELIPDEADVQAHLHALEESYRNRGITLVRVSGKYQFRTAPDLGFLLRREVEEQKRLSRAAVETLAIIAYHQPVTRAQIEEIRGVGLSKGTLDVLMEAGWVRPKGRRKSPGRPMTYGTTEDFLVHFGLESLDDLPGINELKAAGMLDSVEEALERLAEAEGTEDSEDTEDSSGPGDPEGEDEGAEGEDIGDASDHSDDDVSTAGAGTADTAAAAKEDGGPA